MKVFRNWLMACVMVMAVGGVLMASAAPQVASAADPCNKGFLGFPSWYRGLTKDLDCKLKTPDEAGGLSRFIWHIGLNIVEIVLVAVGYISGFYILYGGFLFIISRGNPDGAARARMTMLNAVIGLMISIASVAIVTYIVSEVLK